MSYENILIEKRTGILFLTINRENKLNALNKQTLEELHDILANSLPDEAVKGIILTGAGRKAFVAGADISEFASYDIEQARELASNGQTKVFDLLQNYSKPVIAAINGFALGGGLELAMACHIRIAGATAMLGLPEVSLGLIPGYGGTQRLAQLVGKGRALEIILMADMISAEEAYRIGLVNHIVDTDQLSLVAEEMMTKILSRSPFAVAAAITAVNSGYSSRDGFEAEIREFSKCFGSEDFEEGVDAFLNKRRPAFTGK